MKLSRSHKQKIKTSDFTKTCQLTSISSTQKTIYPAKRSDMRSVRRKDREIKDQEAIELLDCAAYGILLTVGEDNQSYGVPLRLAYKNNWIYFHCAPSGHEFDNIEYNTKVSFSCRLRSTAYRTLLPIAQTHPDQDDTDVSFVCGKISCRIQHERIVWSC
jgi:hypothetical protein